PGLLAGVEYGQRDHFRGLLPGTIGIISRGLAGVRLAVVRDWAGAGRRAGGTGAAGDPAVPAGQRRVAGPGAAAGPVEQVGGGLRDLGLGDLVLAAAGEDLAGVFPGQLAERGGCAVQVLPGDRDPAAVVVVADPEAGDVVRVAVDLPQALFPLDSRVLAAVGVECPAVV